MTEKQEHLLQLFRELDEICKKNNLRYVMAGGTAIGVVRNEGFIPWDDDVDIYMPRDCLLYTSMAPDYLLSIYVHKHFWKRNCVEYTGTGSGIRQQELL